MNSGGMNGPPYYDEKGCRYEKDESFLHFDVPAGQRMRACHHLFDRRLGRLHAAAGGYGAEHYRAAVGVSHWHGRAVGRPDHSVPGDCHAGSQQAGGCPQSVVLSADGRPARPCLHVPGLRVSRHVAGRGGNRPDCGHAPSIRPPSGRFAGYASARRQPAVFLPCGPGKQLSAPVCLLSGQPLQPAFGAVPRAFAARGSAGHHPAEKRPDGSAVRRLSPICLPPPGYERVHRGDHVLHDDVPAGLFLEHHVAGLRDDSAAGGPGI